MKGLTFLYHFRFSSTLLQLHIEDPEWTDEITLWLIVLRMRNSPLFPMEDNMATVLTSEEEQVRLVLIRFWENHKLKNYIDGSFM